MENARPKKMLVNTAEQMNALSSPVRNQIHLHLEILHECTIGQLAECMGREPESLYYHVRLLQKVGIVLEVRKQIVGGRTEAIYALAGKRVMVDRTQSDPKFLKAFGRGIRTLLKFATRSLERCLNDPATNRGGVDRNFRIEQQVARLSAENMKELQQRFDEINQFLAAADDPNVGQPFVVTIAVSTPADQLSGE